MIKGLVSALLGALLVAGLIAGLLWLFASGFLLAIFGFIGVGLVVAAILMFIICFVFALLVFFVLFYYMAEKKPTIQTSGNYKLEDEKGKNE